MHIDTYDYDQNKVHAVSEITSVANSPINSCMQSITYCPLLKASNIIEGSEGIDDYSLSLKYGPDNKRKESKFYQNEILSLTKYYSGMYERTIDAAGLTKEFHLIYGGDGMAAVHIITNEDTENAVTYYMAKDHLGSVMSLFDENENIIEEHSYDAWGNLRNVQNWSFTNVNTDFIYNRGYTGHEMLPNFGLINMNGRIYDPQIGRMLSPDNYVQETYNSQNYNRYTYCLNNPLKYTDPSGNLFKPPFLFRLLGEAADWAGNSLSGNTQPFDMNYAISGNMSNTWQNNPNVLFGSNGYPIGPNGQSYNPYGGLGNSNPWSEQLYEKYTLDYNSLEIVKPVYGFYPVGGGASFDGAGGYAFGVVYYKRKRLSSDSDFVNLSGIIGGGFTLSSSYYSMKQSSLIRNGLWKGKNGKWNSIFWGGNGWTGGRNDILKTASKFKIASRSLTLFSGGISLYEGMGALGNQDYYAASKAGLDLVMTGVSTLGAYGLAIGLIYFGLDTAGAFDERPNTSHLPIFFPNSQSRDITNVKLPIYMNQLTIDKIQFK